MRYQFRKGGTLLPKPKGDKTTNNLIWQPLLKVAAFIFVLLSNSSCSVANVLTAWPRIPDGVVRLKLNSSGTYVAIQTEQNIQVWTVQNGKNTKIVWDFQKIYPHSIPLSFTWWGNDLLLGKSKDNTLGKSFHLLTEREKYALKRSIGETVVTSLFSKKSRAVLPRAYLVLEISPNKKILASATPTDAPQSRTRDGLIDFYNLSATTKSQKIIGHFEKQELGQISSEIPYIIGWSSDNSGIYLVAGNSDNPSLPSSYRQELLFITSEGKMREVLPKSASVIPRKPTDLSLSSILNGIVTIRVEYFNQTSDYIRLNSKGVVNTLSTVKVMDVLKDVLNSAELLAVSPNGRYIIVQDYGKNGYVAKGESSELWVVDLERERKRKLGTAKAIREIYQWNGPYLIVRMDATQDSFSNINSLYIDDVIENQQGHQTGTPSKERWHYSSQGFKTLTPAQQLSLKFLKMPSLVPSNLKENYKQLNTQIGKRKSLSAYKLGNLISEKRGIWGEIVIDSEIKRVVAFSAPNPISPLPEEPVSLVYAQLMAESFMRIYRPELFRSERKFQFHIDPNITYRATYKVKLVFNDEPSNVLGIEVSAIDGKIASYYEAGLLELSDNLHNIVHDSKITVNPLISDRLPTWSPDGKHIAFLSNRWREGYPIWWSSRPFGLFIVDHNGEELKCISTEVGDVFRWSPDSTRLVYQIGKELRVYSLVTGMTVSIPSNQEPLVEEILIGWLTKEDLLLGRLHNGPGGIDLLRWSVNVLEKGPDVIKNWSDQIGNDWGYGSSAISGDGRTMYFTWLNLNDVIKSCSYTLFSLPVSKLKDKPVKITECLPVGDNLAITDVGITANGNGRMIIINPSTGEFSEMQPSLLRSQFAEKNNISMSPNGEYVAFSKSVKISEQKDLLSILHITNVDGRDTKELVPSLHRHKKIIKLGGEK